MLVQLKIVAEEETQLPRAEVPSEWLWSLVDYLSLQRIAVSYQYHAANFSVTFQRIGREAAQRIVDEWSNAAEAAALRGSTGSNGLLLRA